MAKLRKEVVVHLVDQPFFTILLDALHHLRQAVADTESPRFVRAVVLNSALLLEATANTLLEAFLDDHSKGVLERKSVLTKISACVQKRCGRSVDIKSKEFQAAAELISIRNAFVHPKSVETRVELKKWEGNKVSGPIEPEKSELLGIPRSSRWWSENTAFAALWAACVFLRYVVVDLLELDREEAFELFCSRQWGDGPYVDEENAEGQYWDPELLDLVEYGIQYRCDFSFLLSKRVGKHHGVTH